VAVLDGKLVDTYSGERTAAAIAKWGMSTALKQVSQLLGGASAGGSSGAGSGGKSGGAAAEPGGGKSVVKLTGGNFDEKVIHTKAPVMVEFYAPVRHSTPLCHSPLCHSLMPRFPPCSGVATASSWLPTGPRRRRSWRPGASLWAQWIALRMKSCAPASR
jgi:hypothetical protein